MNKVLKVLLLLLVLVTVCLTAGRLSMRLLDTQTGRIERTLSGMLGAEVTIGAIEGGWHRLNPNVTLTDLTLTHPEEAGGMLTIAEAELSLDLWGSLLRRQLTPGYILVDGMSLPLAETPEGRWTLQGIALGGNRGLHRLLDLLLDTPLITVDEASLELTRADGQQIRLNTLYAKVLNQGSTHNLNLQFRLGEQDAPTRMKLAVQGDPRREFQLDAWLESSDLDLERQLAAVLQPALREYGTVHQLTFGGELWLRADHHGVRAVTGTLHDMDVQGDMEEQDFHVDLRNASLNFSIEASGGRDGRWRIVVQDFAFDWHNNPWEIPRLKLSLPRLPQEPWALQASILPAGLLRDIAATLPLPQAAADAVQALSPSGELRNARLTSDRSGEYPGVFELRANFHDLAVGAWRGAPAGEGLHGYLELSARQGFAEIDSEQASLHLPDLFPQAWHYDHLNARVGWRLDNGKVTVSSSPIHVSNEQLRGRVQFSLNNERLDSGELQSELVLLVGMDYMEVGMHRAYLPKLQRIAGTMRWLDRALLQGSVTGSGFVLRTPIVRNTLPVTTTQSSWYRAEDGVLSFLEDWPQATAERAGVIVRDDRTDVLASAAQIAGIDASQVTARVRPDPRIGPVLGLDIKARSSTAEGIEFLRGTPLREYTGSALDGWEAEGMLDIETDLSIPLGPERDATRVVVRTATEDSTLRISDYDLTVAGLSGRIDYSSENGLQAQGLTAEIFGEPVSMQIQTQSGGAAGTRSIDVTTQGMARIEALSAWSGQPEFGRALLDFLEGDLAYTAVVSVPGSRSAATAPRLSVTSDLTGVRSRFPAPFGKEQGRAAPLQFDLRFDEPRQVVNIRYDDRLTGELVLSAGNIERGQLYFGSLNENFNIRQSDNAAPGLLVNGRLQTFNFDAWRQVAEEISRAVGREELAGAPGDESPLSNYLRLVDVDIGSLQLGEQRLEDINVQVRRQDDNWRVYGENARLAGTLSVPVSEEAPWDIELDYLRFPPREAPDPGAPQVDLLADVDPRTLPAFNFRTGELSIGDSNLGSFSFEFVPQAGGADIRDFRMQEENSLIRGGEEGTGAGITWRYDGGAHRSTFTGTLAAGDLSRVMPKWGHDANIVSRNATFNGQLSWPGSPLAFSLRRTSGTIDMAINNGRFVDIDSGSTRLLGAFNFDALVRRLELDFSDLYQRGFSYDTIRGELEIDDGLVETRTPLIIDGPSSRLSINGEIDLKDETIAADMQVRIPLGENISLLAGLLGAWPIAVSTYLASKIFSDQVEEFTTVVYRLEGPWNAPDAGFEPPEEAAAGAEGDQR